MITIGELDLDEWTPVEPAPTGAESLHHGTGTVTSTSSSAPIILPSNALQPYLVHAAEWGREAGEQWVRDLENHFAIQTVTGAFTGTGSGTLTTFYPPRELTPEQAEEAGRYRREEEYQSDRAGWKAHDLLMANLTPRQREGYAALGRFTVKTKRGHRYVIGKARCQNVVRLNRRGRPMRTYCVTVGGGVPVEDVMLGQLLMLRHDEDHFLRVARQWPVRFALGVSTLVKTFATLQTIDGGTVTLPVQNEAA